MVLRRMSVSVANLLQQGIMPNTEAALIKELGNAYERLVPEAIRMHHRKRPPLIMQGC